MKTDPVEITFIPAGSNGIGKLIAKVGGRTIHLDKIDTGDAAARDRFAEQVCGKGRKIRRDAVDAELLKIAMERAEAPAPAEAPWPPPVPLDAPGADLPEFPIDALPGVHRDFAEALAEAVQVPRILTGMLTMGAVSAAVAGRWSVKLNESWSEPTNLYQVCAQPPGSRKSAAVSAVTAPLAAWQTAAAIAAAPEIEAAKTKWAIAEKGKLRAIDAASKATDQAERTAMTMEAEAAARELAGIRIPPVPRLLADDVTPEELIRLLAEQGGRLAVISPEGGVLDVVTGSRYSASGASNLDPILKSHSGDSVRVDRVGRPPQYIAKPALVLALAVQPDVLQAMHAAPGFAGRGLLARFIYGIPAPLVGRRNTRPAAMPTDVSAAWGDMLRRLLDMAPQTDQQGQPQPTVLTFAPAAQEMILQLVDRLEPRLGADGDLADVAEWASKLAGAAVRIAGVLHLSAHASADDLYRASNRINEATTAAAIRIAEWAIPHAMAAFRTMGGSAEIVAAKVVLRWIIANDQAEFSRRDLYQSLRRNRLFQSPEKLDKPLELLVAHAIVRQISTEDRRGPGRKPTTRWAVNPGIRHSEDFEDIEDRGVDPGAGSEEGGDEV